MILEKQGDTKVYSDTLILEQEMLEIARKYPEDLSQDFIAKDNRYTVNNTFSSVRRNLLNWYHFRENAAILEVGAGMGALTGCLCDQCKSVTALEMSKQRAEVIRCRYPKRSNLEIICEDLFTWSTDRKFDYAVVVGVLEYAAIFGKKYEEPFLEFIKRLKGFLTKDGTVLLAIENRFGLKYWCGASEDHLCQPFQGIAGYEEKNTAVTFSKADLERLFKESGFEKIKFFYVLPDYKFPTVIYTDDYAPGASAIQKTAFQYAKGSKLIYDEKKLYKEVIDNHTEGFFANSFLIEAPVSGQLSEQPVYIAGKSECKKEFRVSTLIYADGRVEKIAMHSAAEGHLQKMMQYQEELVLNSVQLLKSDMKDGKIVIPYYKGMIAEDYFHQMLQKNDMHGIHMLLEQLELDIKKSSAFVSGKNILWEIRNQRKDYGPVLKHGYIDMTFSNCFWVKDKLLFFDQEWRFDHIPMRFILFFAIRQSYLSFTGKSGITLEHLYKEAQIEENEIEDFIFLERYLWDQLLYRQEHLYDRDGWYNDYSEKMALIPILQKYDGLDQAVREKDNELIRIGKELERKNNYISYIEQELAKKNNYILDVEQELRKKNAYIVHIEQELVKKDGHIQEIEKLLMAQQEFIQEEQKKISYRIRKLLGQRR